jgi:hypothetical protein
VPILLASEAGVEVRPEQVVLLPFAAEIGTGGSIPGCCSVALARRCV